MLRFGSKLYSARGFQKRDGPITCEGTQVPHGLGMALNSAMRTMRPGSNPGLAERHLSSFIRAAR
jgi:hypothetical protein